MLKLHALLLRNLVNADFDGTRATMTSPWHTIVILRAATAITVDSMDNCVALLADIAPHSV